MQQGAVIKQNTKEAATVVQVVQDFLYVLL